MKHDIYVKFWENAGLDEKFKKWIEDTWEKVRNNRNIDRRKKPGELRKILEEDTAFFHNLVIEFLCNNEYMCPVLYAKLQRVLQHYIEVQRRDFISFVHSLKTD